MPDFFGRLAARLLEVDQGLLQPNTPSRFDPAPDLAKPGPLPRPVPAPAPRDIDDGE